MLTQSTSTSLIHKILIILVLVNILGDIFNIIGWYAIPGGTGALRVPLYVAAGTLAIVVAVFTMALYGLIKKATWGPLLVIGITITNRVDALLIFRTNFSSLDFWAAWSLWTAWSIILIIVSYLDYRQLTRASKT
jgi:hypothetical protein